MKKAVLVLLVGLILSTMGFAGGVQQQEEGPVTITWATHPVIYAVTDDGAMFEKFTAETGITVNVVTFPTEALAERIPAEFIAGSSAFDVMSIAESFWTVDLAQYVEDLGPWNNENPLPDGGLKDFSPGQIRQFRVPQLDSGTMYGIPHRMGVDIMFYRKDLFQQHGISVPKSIDEYYEAAKKLTLDTNNDGVTDIYGVTYQGIQGQHGVLDWYDMAAPLGANMLEPPDWKKAGFNNAAGIKALEIRKKLYQEGLASPGVLSYSFGDVIDVMSQGKAAMTIMYGPYWAQLENPEKSKVVGKIGYAAPPRDPNVLDAFFVRGWAVFVNKKSKYKDAAWKFIRYFTAKDQQLFMALKHGNPPSRFSVLQSPEYKEKVPAADAQADALKNATIQPNISELPQVNEILAKYIHAGISGDMSPKDAFAKAEAEINVLLK